MIGIIDYGAGNLRSVKKAFDFLEIDALILDQSSSFDQVERLVLPGVGSFAAAMQKLKEKELIDGIRYWIKAGRPFLGICLGMQILYEGSEESPESSGLGVLPGIITRFKAGKVPQVGWNRVCGKQESRLLNNLPGKPYFYFLHGFHAPPSTENWVAGETDYGLLYPTIIEKGNLCAVQFHPEKSAENGLALLKNWLSLPLNQSRRA